MREIKFRAWDSDNKQMLYFGEAEKLMNHAGVFFRINNIFKVPCDFKELMQYTGLKDKNGKEIYEGDIVRILIGSKRERIDTIIWNMYQAGFAFTQAPSGSVYGGEFIEVIGNIYENPNLMKKGE